MDGLPREIVGHAQPNPTRVKVGEDLVKQPAPALKRGFERLTLQCLALPGRSKPALCNCSPAWDGARTRL